MATVRHVNRAISPRDVEALALDFAPEIVRARCIRPSEPEAPIVVAVAIASPDPMPQPGVATRDGLAQFLTDKAASSWAAAGFHVVGPEFVRLRADGRAGPDGQFARGVANAGPRPPVRVAPPDQGRTRRQGLALRSRPVGFRRAPGARRHARGGGHRAPRDHARRRRATRPRSGRSGSSPPSPTRTTSASGSRWRFDEHRGSPARYHRLRGPAGRGAGTHSALCAQVDRPQPARSGDHAAGAAGLGHRSADLPAGLRRRRLLPGVRQAARGHARARPTRARAAVAAGADSGRARSAACDPGERARAR